MKKGKKNSWVRFLGFCRGALSLKCNSLSLLLTLIFYSSKTCFTVPHQDDKEGWVTRNKKLSDMWSLMSKDQKRVFQDPFFFALANIPDLANEGVPDGANDNTEEDLFGEVAAPQVYQLSEEEEVMYRPIFNELVDVEKLHVNHGQPQPSESSAQQQRKSLAAFRRAHHDVSTLWKSDCFHFCGLIDFFGLPSSHSLPPFASSFTFIIILQRLAATSRMVGHKYTQQTQHFWNGQMTS